MKAHDLRQNRKLFTSVSSIFIDLYENARTLATWRSGKLDSLVILYTTLHYNSLYSWVCANPGLGCFLLNHLIHVVSQVARQELTCCAYFGIYSLPAKATSASKFKYTTIHLQMT